MEKYLNPHTETAPSSEIEKMFLAMATYAKSDIINAVNTAKTEGFDEGFDIGREQGIDIGREQGIDIGREQGIDIGAKKRSIEIAKRMKGKGICADDISDLTGLSVEEIEKI